MLNTAEEPVTYNEAFLCQHNVTHGSSLILMDSKEKFVTFIQN